MHEEKGHKPAEPATAPPESLEAIMAAGDVPKKGDPNRGDPNRGDTAKGDPAPAPEVGKPKPPDLSANALAAAKAAQEPIAVHQAGGDTPVAPPPSATSPRREWVWRGALLLNVAVLAAVIALPSQPQVAVEAPSAVTARQIKPERRIAFALSEQTFYLRALELAGEGKFDDAIAVLDGYLKANPDLVEVEQRLIYHAMAMFAVRVGRADDASRYEAAMDRLRVGAQLPQDLLDLAKVAEAEGRGADMRRHYARFLLQHKQVPPTLQARIAEAYLKLGDGYRVEAEQGAQREAVKKAADDAEAAKQSSGDKPAPVRKASGAADKGDHE